MAKKEAKQGGEKQSAHKRYGDEPGKLDGVDVDDVAVGASHTMWGGKNADSKAKGILRADLKTDKNMTNDGPLGNVGYGGGHYTNKK